MGNGAIGGVSGASANRPKQPTIGPKEILVDGQFALLKPKGNTIQILERGQDAIDALKAQGYEVKPQSFQCINRATGLWMLEIQSAPASARDATGDPKTAAQRRIAY